MNVTKACRVLEHFDEASTAPSEPPRETGRRRGRRSRAEHPIASPDPEPRGARSEVVGLDVLESPRRALDKVRVQGYLSGIQRR